MGQKIMRKKDRSTVKGVMYRNLGGNNNTINGKTYNPQPEKDRKNKNKE